MINKLTVIEFPLRGEWKFLRPLGHDPFAFDFVKMNKHKMHIDNPLKFIVSSIPSNHYLCWSEPVYSPISGIVIRCVNDWPDHIANSLINMINRWYQATCKCKSKEESGLIDIRPNAGNHIMIQSNEGFIVFLAHLKQRSLKVNLRQFVEAGDLIAEVGNSGNSTAPHLHINLFDQVDNPFKSKVLPFVFDSFQHKKPDGSWQAHNLTIPQVKSVIRSDCST